MDIVLRRQWFISSKTTDIQAEYKFLEEIGRGAYGKVFKSQHIDSGIIRAIKVIQKESINDYNTFISEISILKDLDHPNIINIIETYESQRLCYLVLEYYDGGDLFDRVIKEKRLSEETAANIMSSLFSAVMYCHSFNVCHRDMKPENCLYMSPDANSDIKIIDFGLSVVSNEAEALHDVLGTPYYIAPEVLTGSYSKLADCWSLGIILYMLLSGHPPFKGKNNQEILTNVYNANVTFRAQAFKVVSNAAKDLISRLLVKDPAYRLTAEQAYKHPWIAERKNCIFRPLPESIVENIEKFVKSINLKKAALMFIASKMDEREIMDLRDHFKQIDSNGDGFISRNELCRAIAGIKDLTETEIEQIAQGVDFNCNGFIDYTEFITCCLQTQNYTNKGLLKTAFKYFDKDGSGFITFEELNEVINGNDVFFNESSKIHQMIKEADVNEDGKIDYTEFLTMLSINSDTFN